MYTYEKSLLRAYGSIEDVIELMDRSFYKRAVGSHASRLSAYDEAEELIELIELKKDLIELYVEIGNALSKLKAEDFRLLDEKYGLKKEAGVTDEKTRNYFRKLALAIGRFSYRLRDEGVTEEKFKDYLGKFHFIAEAYAEEKAKEKNIFGEAKKARVVKKPSEKLEFVVK